MNHIVWYNFFGLKFNGELGILEDMKAFSTCTAKFLYNIKWKYPKPDNTCYDLLCVVNIKITLTEQEITREHIETIWELH